MDEVERARSDAVVANLAADAAAEAVGLMAEKLTTVMAERDRLRAVVDAQAASLARLKEFAESEILDRVSAELGADLRAPLVNVSPDMGGSLADGDVLPSTPPADGAELVVVRDELESGLAATGGALSGGRTVLHRRDRVASRLAGGGVLPSRHVNKSPDGAQAQQSPKDFSDHGEDTGAICPDCGNPLRYCDCPDGNPIMGGESCCGADMYWCPVAGRMECPIHGGFNVCCDQPERHTLLSDFDPVLAAQAAHYQCECGHGYGDHTSGIAVGCDAMDVGSETVCPCTEYRPVGDVDG